MKRIWQWIWASCNDVDQIAGRLPEKLQMLVFSATIPERNWKGVPEEIRRKPIYCSVETEHIIAPAIDNLLLSTKGRAKIDVLYQVLTMGEPYLALIFANAKQEMLRKSLMDWRQRGIQPAVLWRCSGSWCKRIMRRVHNLEYQFMVATDLAARGIDIEGVSHVIRHELPKDMEFFVHHCEQERTT